MVLNVQQGKMFLNSYLKEKDRDVIFRRFPTLPFDNGTAVFSPENLPWGAEYISQEKAEFIGQSRDFISDLSDVPLVSVSIGDEKFTVGYQKIGYTINLMELEKLKFAKANGQIVTDIVGIKSNGVSRILSEYGNHTGAYGIPARGMTGCLNDPNVETVNSSIDFNSATDNDVVDFFTEQITQVCDKMNLTGEPNVIYVVKKLYKRICSIRPNDNWSVIQSILETNKEIINIVPFNEGKSEQLEKFNVQPEGTNRDLMWITRLDPMVCKRRKTRRWRLPTEYADATYKIIFLQGFAQVQYTEPFTSRYVTYPA